MVVCAETETNQPSPLLPPLLPSWPAICSYSRGEYLLRTGRDCLFWECHRHHDWVFLSFIYLHKATLEISIPESLCPSVCLPFQLESDAFVIEKYFSLTPSFMPSISSMLSSFMQLENLFGFVIFIFIFLSWKKRLCNSMIHRSNLWHCM